MPADLLELVDVRRFRPGERIVPQPSTREMYERTQGWMRERDLIDVSAPRSAYDHAVLG
jgi:NitT/TauT family transport system substrate-binding protein